MCLVNRLAEELRNIDILSTKENSSKSKEMKSWTSLSFICLYYLNFQYPTYLKDMFFNPVEFTDLYGHVEIYIWSNTVVVSIMVRHTRAGF